MDVLWDTLNWFKDAVPEPDDNNLGVQLGCHFEEIAELLDTLGMIDPLGKAIHENLCIAIKQFADLLKQNPLSVYVINKQEYMDALADQLVTATGSAYMYGIDLVWVLTEVNRSNYSKFENGKPVFDANGKIKKGSNYTPPDFTPFLKD